MSCEENESERRGMHGVEGRSPGMYIIRVFYK